MSATSTLVAVGVAAGVLLPATAPTPAAAPAPAIVHADTTPTPTPTARASRYRRISQLPAVWQRLAWCESRYRMRATSPSGKHHGLFQIHEGFFKAKGVDWRTADIAAQYKVALYVYARQGAKAWTCARQAGLR